MINSVVVFVSLKFYKEKQNKKTPCYISSISGSVSAQAQYQQNLSFPFSVWWEELLLRGSFRVYGLHSIVLLSQFAYLTESLNWRIAEHRRVIVCISVLLYPSERYCLSVPFDRLGRYEELQIAQCQDLGKNKTKTKAPMGSDVFVTGSLSLSHQWTLSFRRWVCAFHGFGTKIGHYMRSHLIMSVFLKENTYV